MHKNKIIISTLLITSLFTGCANNMQETISNTMDNISKSLSSSDKTKKVNNQKSSEIILSAHSPIAYAIMIDNGEKLFDIINTEPKDIDIYNKIEKTGQSGLYELIKITKDGFYPNYETNYNLENQTKYNCVAKINRRKGFCKSYYTEFSTIFGGDTSISVRDKYRILLKETYFNKEKFINIIKNNNLDTIQTELSTMQNKIDKNLAVFKSLYDNKYSLYKQNMKNITLKHQFIDKSGLLINEPTIKLTLIENIPQEYDFGYDKVIEQYLKKEMNLEAALINIDGSFDKIYKDYKKYLDQNFQYYSISSSSYKKFKLNDYISYNGKIHLTKVPYVPNKKITHTVKSTIYSANINQINIDKPFILKDNNLYASFSLKKSKYGVYRFINTSIQNNSNAYLTVKSITNYTNKNVLTKSAFTKELPPKSQTLENELEFTDFAKELSFKNLTKSSALKQDITYGYALKYTLNNQSKEYSLYGTNKYNLYHGMTPKI